MNKPATSSARGFEPVTALLLAVVLAGMFNVIGPVVSALTLPTTISSLSQELGSAPHQVRGLVVSEFLWLAIPSVTSGVAMVAAGMWALRRSGGLKAVRWTTVVGGVGLSVVLSIGLGLFLIGVTQGIRQLV